ncbi:fumarylacetoacetate hydrolase family protein [Sediminivirga luteola]|uniref:Gentisate 1,2-dioxygenase n=1 Tax=Sediminivirga luteola TaxID=1774748 RepID=A0A8J2XEN3_9MICO|nr:fumarylacetoacetate hydrolase family protein [Sediminivirga luteola]MCI2267036.1 fumarylacetoacetate hydrolase family protein [Sediminivirga luteola]GGA09434.1 gentisate 1,2-dioxygenase [Sediminivirga luteola]
MRIARVTTAGDIVYAASDGDDTWYSLSALGFELSDSAAVVQQIPAIRERIAQAPAEAVVTPGEFLAPVVRPPKSLAIGRNYALHVKETGSDLPEKPVLFSKFPSSFIGSGERIVADNAYTEEVDYEVELVVLIGRTASAVSQDEALDYVAGYLVGNDVSARNRQRDDKQYDLAKGMDTFGPIGPWITTADAVPDPQDLDLSTTVDGEVRQSSNTRNMIFSIPFLIEYLSRVITLEPGDVLWTGTPHGVALGMEGTPFLREGQTVTCEVEGLGALVNPVSFDRSAAAVSV